MTVGAGMEPWLVAGPVAVPLLAAGVSLVLGRAPVAQRALGLVVLAALVADAALLLVAADTSGPVVLHAGGHRPPLGITLVGDRLSALLLLVAAAVLLAVLVYAVGQGTAEHRSGNVPSVFHPTYLVLTGGISLAFLTGDLFTLFVGFEVMLMASYALITIGATRERVRAGMTYVVTSLLASILLVTTVGLVYGATGTVNLAELSERTSQLDDGMRSLLSVMLLLALGIKAAVVPLHWWLPDSYPDAPAPITAIFAALLTKVAVYAIVRTQSLLFPRDEAWVLLLVLAALTLTVGILGALAQQDLNRILSFVLVSHVGYMLLGLGLSTESGSAGTVLYLVHHVVVQAALFLLVGLVVRERGTASLGELGGLARTAPALSVLFLVPALSLGGMPPLAGFVGKLSVLQATVEAGGVLPLTLAVIALVVSLLTLAVMARVWVRAFWGPPAAPVPDPDVTEGTEESERTAGSSRLPGAMMVGAAAAAVGLGLTVAAAAGPLAQVAAGAAGDLRDPSGYREAVLTPAPAEPSGGPEARPWMP